MKTKMYISCILALMITAAAWAAEGPTSPTKAATAELNGTQADQFMDLTGWSDVKFDKLFTYAGFAQKKVKAKYVLDLGAAFKAGPVYIGAWYQGNLGKVATNENNKQVTTEISESLLHSGTLDKTKRTSTQTITKPHDAEHNAAVLVGFGNIGVRLGYARSGENKTGTYFGTKPGATPSTPAEDVVKSDSVVTDSKAPHIVKKTTYDPKGYSNGASRTARVDFGMKLAAGALSLSPTVGLGVDINQASQYGVETQENRDTLLNTHNITKTVKGKNETATTLNVTLGTGLDLNDSLHSAFSFGYDLGLDIYGTKKHRAADGTTKELANTYEIKTDTRDDVETGAKLTVTDAFNATTHTKSNVKNTITLGYSMRKDFTDRLSFFAGVKAPIRFDFAKDVTNSVDTWKEVTTDKVNQLNNRIVTTTTTGPAKTVNTTTVNLNPVLSAALSYAAIPDRVFVSFGTEVKPFGQAVIDANKQQHIGYEHQTQKTTVSGFTQTTETKTEYPNDKARNNVSSTTTAKNDTEKSIKTVTYGKAAVEVKLGVRWNIVDAVSFDVMYNKSILEPIEWLSIGNLKLACTIKF